MANRGMHKSGRVPSRPGRSSASCKWSATEEIFIAGETVSVFNDEHFYKVRQAFDVGPHMLGIDMFSFSSLRAGGSKGGSLMQFTNNQKLLVKQLSKDDICSILTYAQEYCEHVLNAPTGSLLSRFFYHFQRPKDGQHYIVMNNCMPAMRAVDALWDLKGCCDDKIVRQGGSSVPQVHKRWYMVHWLAAEAFGDCVGVIPLGRKRYKQGKTRARTQKFELQECDYHDVLFAVKSDVEFLKGCGLMDYSLIVGCLTERLIPGTTPRFPPGGFGRQPYIVRSGDWVLAYYVGIIDFLQNWSMGKRVAHVIKVLFAPKPISTITPDEYAEQFLEANENRFSIIQTLDPQVEVLRLASPDHSLHMERNRRFSQGSGKLKTVHGAGNSRSILQETLTKMQVVSNASMEEFIAQRQTDSHATPPSEPVTVSSGTEDRSRGQTSGGQISEDVGVVLDDQVEVPATLRAGEGADEKIVDVVVTGPDILAASQDPMC